jgi:hypothetical protein
MGLGFDQHPNFYAAFLLLIGAYLAYAGFNSATRFSK